MRSLKAFSFLFGFAMVVGCQGPDEFYRLNNDDTGTAGASSPGAGGSAVGSAGSSAAGVAGTTGRGGATSGSAGSIVTGTGGSVAGTAGVTGAGGAAGSGTAGSSSRGGTSGSAGASGTTGGGGSTTGRGGTPGTAGASGATGAGGVSYGGSGGSTGGSTATAGSTGTAGSSSRGGTTGAGGAAGSSSRGGTTGSGGASAGSGGATGTAGAGGRGPDRIQVQAQCQSASGMQDIRVTFRILNPESTAKQWSDIKVRYYFTLTAQLTPNVVIDYAQKISKSAITTTATNSYVEVGFTTAAGMIAGFDNVTGSDEIQLHMSNYSSPTWNASQTDDYSFKVCASGASTSAYTDRPTMPGYYQGDLAWGSEP